jgi:hypothetical protein
VPALAGGAISGNLAGAAPRLHTPPSSRERSRSSCVVPCRTHPAAFRHSIGVSGAGVLHTACRSSYVPPCRHIRPRRRAVDRRRTARVLGRDLRVHLASTDRERDHGRQAPSKSTHRHCPPHTMNARRTERASRNRLRALRRGRACA